MDVPDATIEDGIQGIGRKLPSVCGILRSEPDGEAL
jgi:hypothetical protein